MSFPVTLKFIQPVFGVNKVKWNRRIEPVRYAEAKAAFITATEEVTMRAITYYFNLLLAEETWVTATQRSEEHTSELQSRQYLVCRLLLEKKKDPSRQRGQIGREKVTIIV